MPGTKKHTHFLTVSGPRYGILSISKITLGENYLIPEDIENSRYRWYCIIDDGGRVRGFISFTMRGNMATIADVAVDPVYQGCGWGSHLISTVLRALESTQVDTVRCPAWETSKGVHLDKALKKNGFKRKDRILRTPEDARSDFLCPVCGSDCKCYMVIYETSINNIYGEIQYSR